MIIYFYLKLKLTIMKKEKNKKDDENYEVLESKNYNKY